MKNELDYIMNNIDDLSDIPDGLNENEYRYICICLRLRFFALKKGYDSTMERYNKIVLSAIDYESMKILKIKDFILNDFMLEFNIENGNYPENLSCIEYQIRAQELLYLVKTLDNQSSIICKRYNKIRDHILNGLEDIVYIKSVIMGNQ